MLTAIIITSTTMCSRWYKRELTKPQPSKRSQTAWDGAWNVHKRSMNNAGLSTVRLDAMAAGQDASEWFSEALNSH